MERKGFTLIELMIVIAIIIILAAIAIPNYLRMTSRAKVSAIESDMKSIGTALEAYNTDWSKYPDVSSSSSWDDLKKELTGKGTLNNSSSTTLTGETGGIEYIKPEALTAFEKKVDPNSINYSVTNGEYILTAKATISGKTYTFTMTPGGQITVQ